MYCIRILIYFLDQLIIIYDIGINDCMKYEWPEIQKNETIIKYFIHRNEPDLVNNEIEYNIY